MVGEATVRLGRRHFENDAVVGFPLDRVFGAALGQKRWLRVKTTAPFRPHGFLAWGVSDPPPFPATADAPPPPAFSWCHRFTIRGRDQLMLQGGFGLHYFRIAHTFDQVLAALCTPAGEPLTGPFEDAFMGVLENRVDIRARLMIPTHCELDFNTAAIGDELALEVSGPLDRIVAWGKVAL